MDDGHQKNVENNVTIAVFFFYLRNLVRAVGRIVCAIRLPGRFPPRRFQAHDEA